VEQRYQAVLAVIRDGVSIVQVAHRFGVSRQAVHRWLRWYEDQGAGRARRSVPRSAQVLAPIAEASRGWANLGRMRSALAEELEPLPAAGQHPHLLPRTSATRSDNQASGCGCDRPFDVHSTDGPRTGTAAGGWGSNELVGSPVQSALCTRGAPLAGDVPRPTRRGPRRSRNIR
jgi:transposase-like protein